VSFRSLASHLIYLSGADVKVFWLLNSNNHRVQLTIWFTNYAFPIWETIPNKINNFTLAEISVIVIVEVVAASNITHASVACTSQQVGILSDAYAAL